MASITKRGDTYRVRVSNGFDVNGKRKWESATFTPTAKTERAIAKEVEAFAYEFEKLVKGGACPKKERQTFKDVTQVWLESSEQSLSDHGENYISVLEKYAFPVFGAEKISSITRMDVQSFINDLSNKDGLSPASVRRIKVIINSVFKFAEDMGCIRDGMNPCSKLKMPKAKTDRALHVWNEEQCRVFLNEALTKKYVCTKKAHDRIDDTGKPYHVNEYTEEISVSLMFRALFALALAGGFRRGELAALTWKDVNLFNNTVSVNKAAALRKEGSVIKSPKSDSGYRVVPVRKAYIDLLRKWKKEEEKLRKDLGTAWEGPEDFEETNLFIQATGKMIDPRTIGKKFNLIIERFNASVENDEEKLPIIRLHDLRHTYATIQLKHGVDVATLARLLGHSKVSTTTDNYCHATEEGLKDAANNMDLLEDIA